MFCIAFVVFCAFFHFFFVVRYLHYLYETFIPNPFVLYDRHDACIV